MKQPDIVGLINQIQAQLSALDKKVDTLINRSSAEVKSLPKPVVNNNPAQKPNGSQPKERMMFKAICADCQKECSIPFKPTGDRPVYCKDCFSKRKMISMSKIGIDTKPAAASVQPAVNAPVEVKKSKAKVTKKKVAVAKKPVAKKKAAPKKK